MDSGENRQPRSLRREKAERRVEAAMLYLVGSGVGLVWSTWVLTRGRDGRRLLIGSGGVLGLAVLVDLAVLASH